MDKGSYQLVDAYPAKIWALVNKMLTALAVNCESMIKVESIYQEQNNTSFYVPCHPN